MLNDTEQLASRLRVLNTLERWRAVTQGATEMADKDFRMVPKPDLASDSLIEKMSSIFGNDLKLAEATTKAMERVQEAMRPALNPETLANGRSNEIDLRRKYDIQTEYHGSFRGKHHWSAIDANSYTGPDPDGGVGSCVGAGESDKEAKLDLRDKIAAAEEKPKPRMGRLVDGGSGVQPPEYAEEPYVDPDEDNAFDADLTDDR
jgi:hypothetical protein